MILYRLMIEKNPEAFVPGNQLTVFPIKITGNKEKKSRPEVTQ